MGMCVWQNHFISSSSSGPEYLTLDILLSVQFTKSVDVIDQSDRDRVSWAGCVRFR